MPGLAALVPDPANSAALRPVRAGSRMLPHFVQQKTALTLRLSAIWPRGSCCSLSGLLKATDLEQLRRFWAQQCRDRCHFRVRVSG